MQMPQGVIVYVHLIETYVVSFVVDRLVRLVAKYFGLLEGTLLIQLELGNLGDS